MSKSNAKFSVSAIRKEFPILTRKVHGKKLIYFDNAATTQKPQTVLDAVERYYTRSNANVKRGIHTLGEEASELYENARKTVAQFLDAPSEKNIVFLKNATEGFNLIANGLARDNLSAHDSIVVSVLEHHSNYLPWFLLSKKTGCRLQVLQVSKDGYINLDEARGVINEKTKFVAVTHMSNVLGTLQPVEEIVRMAREVGAYTIIDGAQAVAHIPLSVKEIGADAYIFSGHKVFGPTGIGAMYATDDLLSRLSPIHPGGGTILDIRGEKIVWNDIPYRFEGGTPHIAGAVGFAEALKWFQSIDKNAAKEHEQSLLKRAVEVLSVTKSIKIFGSRNDSDTRAPILSFSIKDIHPHDIAAVFDEEGIAIRAGHHCAKPLMASLNTQASARISLSLYNTIKEVDRMGEVLAKIKKLFT